MKKIKSTTLYERDILAFTKEADEKTLELVAKLTTHLTEIQKGKATKQLKKLITELESTPTFTKYLNKLLNDIFKTTKKNKGGQVND